MLENRHYSSLRFQQIQCCAAVAQLRQNDAVAARTPEATGQPLGTTGSYRELLRDKNKGGVSPNDITGSGSFAAMPLLYDLQYDGWHHAICWIGTICSCCSCMHVGFM